MIEAPLPNISKRELQELLRELYRLREAAQMAHANFGDEGLTQRVKDTTYTYRQTWLVSPIQNLVDRYEAALKNVEAKKEQRRERRVKRVMRSIE